MNQWNYPWTNEPRRYKPRLICLNKMSGLDHKDMRCLPPDLEAIREAFRQWRVGNCLDWEEFFAHIEIPAWDEMMSQHSNKEVVHINWSAVSVSDAMVVHAYDGGTGALGWLMCTMALSSRRPPVLVVAHCTESVSKAWLGLEELYANITIVRFEDAPDLYQKVQEWLTAKQAVIAAGPTRRLEIDGSWSPLSILFQDAWRRCGDNQRARLLELTQLDEHLLTLTLATPSALNDLPVGTMTELITTLEVDVVKSTTAQSARQLLDNKELRAWTSWAQGKNSSFTWRILAAVVAERAQPVVAREPDYLGQPGAWQRYAESWIRNAAS